MSPDQKRDFETEWPRLARRLNALLVRKQIPADLREDIVQETALRLYGAWVRVDRSRSAWALTATIALNLVRDQSRRVDLSRAVAQVPELTVTDDVEESALARVELGRVRSALAQMSAEQRSVLLAEVGIANGSVPTGATKMRRLRARRKLRQVLERAVALVVFPARRVSDVGQALIAVRESLARAGACVACLLVGFGPAIGIPSDILQSETPRGDAGTIEQESTVGYYPAIHSSTRASALLDDASFIPASKDLAKGATTGKKARSERAGNGGATTATGDATAGGAAPVSSTAVVGEGSSDLPPQLPTAENPVSGDVEVPEVEGVEPPAPPEEPSLPSAPGDGGDDAPPDAEQVAGELEATVEDVALEVADSEEEIGQI